MKRPLLDLLACPMCRSHPLNLHVFEEKKEIAEGLLTCQNCSRWYPIIEEIPYMLPDKLRNRTDDLSFLKKWQMMFPEPILMHGKPFNKEDIQQKE